MFVLLKYKAVNIANLYEAGAIAYVINNFRYNISEIGCGNTYG